MEQIQPPHIRFRAGCEVRMEGTQPIITGVVMPWETRTEIGAFSEAFLHDSLRWKDPIKLNLLHQQRLPIASTGDGTLLLSKTDSGLLLHAEPADSEIREGVLSLLKTGVLTGLSVEFRAIKDHFVGRERTVELARLTGIGLVDKPAYEDAAVQIEERWLEEASRAAASPASSWNWR